MITREEFENIALLSKLYVAEDEYSSVCADLQQMMDFADEVSQAPVETEQSRTFEYTPLRKDEVSESLSKSDVLSNARLCENGYFKVEKND